MVAPTLVRGVYAISNQQKRFVRVHQRSRNAFRGLAWVQYAVCQRAQPRPLTIDETAGLRSEVVAAIDFDKLPKVTHGEGGGRRIVLFRLLIAPPARVWRDTHAQVW